MEVGLFYNRINGEWIYDGFERQLEPSIKEQKQAITIFMKENEYDMVDMINSCYSGDNDELLIYLDIEEDGSNIASNKISIIEYTTD